uniref:Uncharacterized protein n=1 Tax=Arundo donax TaxID=35708 RepID=A0A0A8YJL7_ARUDO
MFRARYTWSTFPEMLSQAWK